MAEEYVAVITSVTTKGKRWRARWDVSYSWAEDPSYGFAEENV